MSWYDMKEIGGFFELQLVNQMVYHAHGLALNSGRNCFRYILLSRRPRKVYMPFYICDSMLEPIRELAIEYEFYSIDFKFRPQFNKTIDTDELILYVNYFGINDRQVSRLLANHNKVVIDNTQAFFSMPVRGTDTFYSARKFFGVADGGYLYTNEQLEREVEQDVSYQKYEHLLKRIDRNAEESYPQYLVHEDMFTEMPLRKMSRLTSAILNSINYNFCRTTRISNFNYVHSRLSEHNELSIDLGDESVPMIYPFLISKKGLRETLIKNRVYVATYWNEVLGRVDEGSVESILTKYLIPIPIDHRYVSEDMDLIVRIIKEYL
jgi:hypothetical protein